jgi:hypothetical protein
LAPIIPRGGGYLGHQYALGGDYGGVVGALFFGPGGAFRANPLTLLSGGIDPAGSTNNVSMQTAKLVDFHA